MSGQDGETGTEASVAPTGDEQDPLTVVAEPVVIDLREGVDTVAAFEADRERRTRRAQVDTASGDSNT